MIPLHQFRLEVSNCISLFRQSIGGNPELIHAITTSEDIFASAAPENVVATQSRKCVIPALTIDDIIRVIPAPGVVIQVIEERDCVLVENPSKFWSALATSKLS